MKTNPSTAIHLGLCIMFPSPGAIERIGKDWDWVWLDGQHGQIAGYDTMLSMVRACHSVGTPAFVRVPGHEASWIGLALDMGADAVIVPQVDNAEQALRMIKAAKFPPLGDRSFGGRRPIDLHGRSYFRENQGKLICQIESPEALENAGEIAALPGVDGLFLGPDDYLLRQGVAIDKAGDESMVGAAIARLAFFCQPLNKIVICVGMGGNMFNVCLENGATHIVAGGDVGFLATGSKSAAENARRAILNAGDSPKSTPNLY
jgi:4-hydroxy-2-oxoheptanedioate aldolase